MKLKGSSIKSGMLRLMEKADVFEVKAHSKDPFVLPLAENSIDSEQPSNNLKREKERLTSVLENHGGVDFKPLGNVRNIFKGKKIVCSSQKKTTMPADFNKLSNSNLNEVLNLLSNKDDEIIH